MAPTGPGKRSIVQHEHKRYSILYTKPKESNLLRADNFSCKRGVKGGKLQQWQPLSFSINFCRMAELKMGNFATVAIPLPPGCGRYVEREGEIGRERARDRERKSER